MTIRTRGELRRLIHRARTAASVLRSPGHRFAGEGERDALAALLIDLADVAQRRHDPDYEPEPDQHHGGEDLIIDLFGDAP